MLNEISFIVKVTAINPNYDYQGNEYIRIEFSYRPPKIPTMVPASVPKEVSEMIEASKNMVQIMVPAQMRAQTRRYANRLILSLTTDEWESLQQKYTVGDEFEIKMKADGNIDVRKT